MNFERFLDFNAFINDPAAAIEKAKELMRKEIETEKSQLELKVKQQEDYRKALNELKKQYEKMRQDAGIDKLEEKLNSLPSEPTPAQPVEETPAVVQPTISFPRTGLAAHNKMKDFFDSSVDDEVKDRVRYLPSDEALEIIANFDGLSEEEINNLGFIER